MANFVRVLVYLDCYNKIPPTGWLIIYRNFLPVLAARKSQFRLPAWLGGGSLPGSKLVPIAVSSRGGRGKWSLWSLFNKEPDPIHDSST